MIFKLRLPDVKSTVLQEVLVGTKNAKFIYIFICMFNEKNGTQ